MQISRVKSSGSSQAEVQELCKPPVSSPPEGAQQEHKPTVLGPAKKKKRLWMKKYTSSCRTKESQSADYLQMKKAFAA